MTLEVNDAPLSLCNDLGRQSLRMISTDPTVEIQLLQQFFFFFFPTSSSAFSVQVGKSLIHPVNVSIMKIGIYTLEKLASG